MDIDQLTAFTRITREGSFTRAALELGVPQPTLSGRIRALETAVGGPLFYRSGRRLTLTERGVRFLPYAERTLELLEEGVERARLAEEGQFGRVTVGVMQSLAGVLLAPATQRFLRTRPRVDLWIESWHSFQVIQMLRDGIVQLGLITSSLLSTDLEPLVHFRDELVLVAHPEHPLAGREPLPFKRIVQDADPFLWIVYSLEMDHLRRRVQSEPGGREVELPAATIREMLLNGTGAGFLTASTARADLEAGRLVELHTTNSRRMVWETALVRLAHRELPPAATAFARVLEEEARALGFGVERYEQSAGNRYGD